MFKKQASSFLQCLHSINFKIPGSLNQSFEIATMVQNLLYKSSEIKPLNFEYVSALHFVNQIFMLKPNQF